LTEAAKLQSSIVNQIIDGTITIDSIGEFQSMLKIFPGNPHLHRALSDLLVKRKAYAAAADFYEKTANLFVASGFVLQAVVAKMRQWQIQNPTFNAIKEFYHRLIENNPRATPLTMFFAALSFRELIALITRLERIVLPAGKMVKKFGDPESNLYMVVSGKLRRRIYPPINLTQKKDQLLETVETEFFGQIYPLEKEQFSQSSTETTTRVELVKITKENLIEIRNTFPSVGPAIAEMFANQRKRAPAPRVSRKTRRRAIPVTVALEVLAFDESNPVLKLNGFAKDLSIGGACLVLDEGIYPTRSRRLIGKSVNIMMSPSNGAITLNIKGAIVWSQVITTEVGDSQVIGIQFDDMPPNLSGLLLVFADNLSHAH
jgi:CRP-like cAMP-binding protein